MTKSITELRELFEAKEQQLEPLHREEMLNEKGERTLDFTNKILWFISMYKDGQEKEFLNDEDVEELVLQFLDCNFVSSFEFYRNKNR